MNNSNQYEKKKGGEVEIGGIFISLRKSRTALSNTENLLPFDSEGTSA